VSPQGDGEESKRCKVTAKSKKGSQQHGVFKRDSMASDFGGKNLKIKVDETLSLEPF